MRNIPSKAVWLVILLAFIIRVISILNFASLDNPEMWEFGMIARNLLTGAGYQFTALTAQVPSAYIPPGLPYIYFMFFEAFGDNPQGYFALLMLNTVLACFSIYLIYLLGGLIYSERTGLLAAIYVCISPVMVFSTINFNSIIIYHLLICMVYLYYLQCSPGRERTYYKYVIMLGIVIGIFTYFRSEMLGLTLILALIFVFKRKAAAAVMLLIIPLLMILPWTVRNYNTFGEFILVSTSMGHNFYIGHGDDESTIEYKERLAKLKEDSTFEIEKSKLSTELAVKYIKSHPADEIKETFRKLYSLWIIDVYRESAKQPLYVITWLSTLLLFIIGMYFSFKNKEIKNKLSFLIIYLIFSTIMAIVFFVIPRYQIQMSFIMIPTAMFGLESIFTTLKKHLKK